MFYISNLNKCPKMYTCFLQILEIPSPYKLISNLAYSKACESLSYKSCFYSNQ